MRVVGLLDPLLDHLLDSVRHLLSEVVPACRVFALFSLDIQLLIPNVLEQINLEVAEKFGALGQTLFDVFLHILPSDSYK